ncbi:MAG: ATP-binding protein [Bacteroidota bacterium]
MIFAPNPEHEDARLKALHDYNVLDTVAEEDFDEIVHLASQICGTSVALISLVDHDRQWFKAQTGYITAKQTPRDISFCSHVINREDEMVIEDAREDIRFHDNPLVHDSDVIFYAGTPLATEDGHKIGSLCVIDNQPKRLDEGQLFALRVLGKQVIAQLENRKKVRDLRIQLDENQKCLKVAEKAKEEANQANEIKSKFLAHMSHEIRTPLHGMIGLIGMMEGGELDKEQREILHMLEKSTMNLKGIINDILDLSKIESGKMTTYIHAFDFRQMVKETFELYQPVAMNKDLDYQVEIGDTIPIHLKMDEMKIRQILSNLLSNAMKFTEAGQIKLVVEQGKQSGQVSWLTFRVQDSGIGISPKKQALIFDEFEQEDESTTAKFGGTGLGMAISQKLTVLMGGEIGLVSPIFGEDTLAGPGTEFWFTLPATHLTEEEKRKLLPNTSDKAQTEDVSGIRVLVAEDNKVNQRIIDKILTKFGVEFQVVSNGEEVLHALTSQDFDLILMDISMPVMDGEEATRIIRQKMKSSIPIVALTANAFDDDMQRYIEQGMNACMGKPFRKEELRAMLVEFGKKGSPKPQAGQA